MVYFEKLSFISFFSNAWKISKYKNNSDIYYIDASVSSKKILVPLLQSIGKNIYQINFKVTDIVDEDGELIRIRIYRYDLFEFKKNLFKNRAYKDLFHKSWNQNSILDYINKGLIDGGTNEVDSVSRMLYVINVVNWHTKKLNIKKSLFIVKKRPWFNLYQEYCVKFNITVIESKGDFFNFFNFKNFIRNYIFLYKFVKNIKYKNNKNNKINFNITNNKLFLEGRGDILLDNNGMHSDFFWQQNSDFSINNIIYKHYSEEERDYFKKNGLYSINEGVYYNSKDFRNYNKPKLYFSKSFKQEHKVVKSLLSSYDLERFLYASLFKRFGVKVYFSWDKYSNKHIALSDAVHDCGGISANWQMAFDGFENTNCLINSDIVFSYSKFSNEIDKKIGSKIKYNVIVGYPKDYASALLKDKAIEIRSQLEDNGAKKIVFVIDENSSSDSRWHTGHDFQRENYSYILEKLIEIPWLGVIFKPKRSVNLRQRLGPIEQLLDKAVSTGRCYIYEDSGRHTTTAPPILAGLSSDICIHSHLSAGTAALECALEGIPTLLIDREGTPYSKLYELPKDKVIFQDWPSAIDSIIKHFNSPNGIPGFGDWSSIIDELDPYQDGMAANRIGSYLECLINGLNDNLDKEVVMENAAKKYIKKWGSDKIITS